MRLSAEPLLIKARIWPSSSLRLKEDLYVSEDGEDEKDEHEDGEGKSEEDPTFGLFETGGRFICINFVSQDEDEDEE